MPDESSGQTPQARYAEMIESFHVELSGDQTLLDADILPDGTWIAAVGADMAESVIFHGTQIPLPRRFKHPIVQIIDEMRFLIVSRVAKPTDRNAMIISKDSRHSPLFFHAGDAIQDVLITDSAIVFTYFDEGVFGDSPVSREGVAVFDFDGQFNFGYLSRVGSAAVDVADCYAACYLRGDAIAFCPYTRFPLVKWNLATGEHSATPIPSILKGPAAISASDDNYFFHSTYESRHTLFNYSGGEFREIGDYKCRLKTLRDGRFLRVDSHGFSVIDCCKAIQ